MPYIFQPSVAPLPLSRFRIQVCAVAFLFTLVPAIAEGAPTNAPTNVPPSTTTPTQPAPTTLAGIELPSTTSFFSMLAQHGVSLQQTLDDPSSGASFSYAKNKSRDSEKETFNSQFALRYNPVLPYEHWLFDGSVAANLKTPDTNKEGYVTVRAALGYRSGPDGENLSLYVRGGPEYEATTDFDVQNLLFDSEITPTWKKYGIDSYYAASDTSQPMWITYRITPRLAFQIGRNLQGREQSSETDSMRLRVIPKIGASILLPRLASYFDLKAISLTADDTLYYMPLEQTKTHNAFNLSMAVGLTDNISFGPHWKIGQMAPYFMESSEITVEMKVGFGK